MHEKEKETKILRLDSYAETPFESEPDPEAYARWELELLGLSKELKNHHLSEHPTADSHSHHFKDSEHYDDLQLPSDAALEALNENLLQYDADDEVHLEIPFQKASPTNGKSMYIPAKFESSVFKQAYEQKPKNDPWYKKMLGKFGISLSDRPKEDNEKKETINPVVEKWIQKNTTFNDRLGMFTGIAVPESDPVMAERSDDIVLRMLNIAREKNWYDERSVDKLLAAAENIGPFSPDIADELIRRKMITMVLNRPELFPTLEYDQALLEKVLGVMRLDSLVHHTDIVALFHDVDWQGLIDEMIRGGDAYSAFEALATEWCNIPVQLTLDQVGKFINMDSHLAGEYLRGDKGKTLIDQYGALELLDALSVHRSIAWLINNGIGNQLAEDEIWKLAARNPENPVSLLSAVSHIEAFENEVFLRAFIEKYPHMYLGNLKCGIYSESFQSYVFDQIKDKFIITGNIYNALVSASGFTKLDHLAHQFLIEECETSLLSVSSLEDARAIFAQTGATGETLKIFDEKYRPLFQERHAQRDRVKQDNQLRKQRMAAEETYFTQESITLQLARANDVLTPEILLEHFDFDHVVKAAPRLKDQIGDTTRSNMIICQSFDRAKPRTEAELLEEFDAKLERAIRILSDKETSETSRAALKKLRSLHENITFIGDKEYQEAVQAIATYWKRLLDEDPQMQILVHTGIADYHEIKSDKYMFDKILQHFSDEELEYYAGRLVAEPSQIKEADPEHLRVVLLDDWTISGSQLVRAASGFVHSYPRFENCLEIQLIAASKKRIALGFKGVNYHNDGQTTEEVPMPVRAYYLAHDAPEMYDDSAKGTHITGAHSSVDYGFDNLIDNYRSKLRDSHPKAYELLTKLALTHIIRPYRDGGYQLTRLDKLAEVTLNPAR